MCGPHLPHRQFAESVFPGGWYRNQFWFRPGEQGDVLLCLGIHAGQMVHVSRRTGISVCVKFSTWPQALNPAYLQDTLRALDAIGRVLAGRERTGDGPPTGWPGWYRPEPPWRLPVPARDRAIV